MTSAEKVTYNFRVNIYSESYLKASGMSIPMIQKIQKDTKYAKKPPK